MIGRYWRGDGPLWRIYWLYGVLASTVLAGVVLWAYRTEAPAWLLLLLLALGAVYTVWIVVAVWRCAFNVAQPRLGQPTEFWAVLARALTIAWALNVVMLVAAFGLGIIGVMV